MIQRPLRKSAGIGPVISRAKAFSAIGLPTAFANSAM